MMTKHGLILLQSIVRNSVITYVILVDDRVPFPHTRRQGTWKKRISGWEMPPFRTRRECANQSFLWTQHQMINYIRISPRLSRTCPRFLQIFTKCEPSRLFYLLLFYFFYFTRPPLRIYLRIRSSKGRVVAARR